MVDGSGATLALEEGEELLCGRAKFALVGQWQGYEFAAIIPGRRADRLQTQHPPDMDDSDTAPAFAC